MKWNDMLNGGTLDDARLVELSLSGNREAFGHLVERYQSPVCALAYSACGDISQSEDFAQETFLIAWRKLGDLKEPAKFKSWLYGIARNLVADTFRRKFRNPLAASEPLSDEVKATAPLANPTDHAISKEEEQILWRSLEQIPEIYREPLILFYREHQSLEKVAATLELSEEAARQRLSRGRKLLREQVIAFVEGALAHTGPGPAFTVGVLALLPAMTLSAKAAILGTAAKGGAALKGAGWAGMAAVFLLPLVAFWGMWKNYGAERDAARSRAERQFYKRYYVRLTCGMIVFISMAFALMSFGKSLLQANPALFAVLMTGGILSYPLIGMIFFKWRARALKQFRAEDVLCGVPAPAGHFLYEYRSRLELLGLPFVHIRFGGSPYERIKARSKIKAWIAITDASAFGVLFAYGGLAVAPISVGACTIGLISYGAMATGVLAIGGFGFGVWSFAGFSFGWQAFGVGCAVAWDAAWGGAYGVAHHYALGGDAAYAAQVNSPFVEQLLRSNPFFRISRQAFSYWVWVAWVGTIPMLISMLLQLRKSSKIKKQKAQTI